MQVSEQQFSVDLEQILLSDKQSSLISLENNLLEPIFFTPYLGPSNQADLHDHNLRNLSGIVKQEVQQLLVKKEEWAMERLQEECEEIIENLKQNEDLQHLKDAIGDETNPQFSQLIIKTPSRSLHNMVNISQVTGKVEQGRFKHLCRGVNRNILYFYNKEINKLIVSHAKFQKNHTEQGLMAFQVVKTKEESSLEDAVWFKDRKGDIFAFHDGTLSIFKYHLKEKNMRQLELRKHELFQNVKKAQSIVYVPQTDRVYYFDQKCPKESFYIQLYRPYREQKEFSNCLSTNLPKLLQINVKFNLFRATYILQMVQGKIIPVIYLFCYHKNYLPVPLYLIRIFQNDKNEVKAEEVYSTQGQIIEQEIKLDFTEGHLSTFKMGQHSILSFYCKINGKRTNIEGKIITKEGKSKVDWSLHFKPFRASFGSKQGTFETYFSREILISNKKAGFQSNQVFQSKSIEKILLINDLQGVQSSQSSLKLAYIPDKNQFVQILTDVTSGVYTYNFLPCPLRVSQIEK